MSRSRSAIAAAASRLMLAGGLAATLAGCYTEHDYVRFPPSDYRERHPITLAEGPRKLDVFLARNRGGLTPEQRADVMSFARSWRHDGSGGIIVQVPERVGNQPSARDSLREVQSIFAANGIPQQSVYVMPYPLDGSAPPSLKLKYSRLIARTPPCGTWPSDIGPTYDPLYNQNTPYWNLGCATQHNLAAMIDNPADLVQARAETPPMQARRSVTMDKYRKGENPAGVYDKFEQGKISDLGK